MRLTKATIVSAMILSLAFQSFEAGARVGSRSSSMSSSRSMSAPSSAPQRVGSGSNAGMQRPDVMNQARSQNAPPQPATAPQPVAGPAPAQPARPGFGVGSMVGAAAAGAAVGYLANSAMHNGYGQNQPIAGNNTGANADPLAANQSAAGGSSPWGFILLLLAGTAAIMGVLMWLSRRREAGDRISPAMARSNVAPLSGSAPDAEQQAFERNALKFFNELQEANNRGDIAHIEEFTVEPLRSQLMDGIRSRATSSRTQTMTMKAERIDLTEEDERSIASVRFRGMVSEDENTAPDRIDEVWHFVRGRQTDSQWQLAGIEQV